MTTKSGALLRQARTMAHMSQTELALHAKITQSVISAYESGRREPSLTTLERMIEATGYRAEIALVPVRRAASLRALVEEHRDELVEQIGALGGRNLRLFGSAARGDDGPESDVDLLVDLDHGVGLFALMKMQGAAEALLGVDVDLVPSDGLKSYVADAVEREGILL